MVNKHKNMILKSVWFKEGEYDRLVSALDSNDKEGVLDIIWEIHLRKDL